jgi:hypothetical protein
VPWRDIDSNQCCDRAKFGSPISTSSKWQASQTVFQGYAAASRFYPSLAAVRADIDAWRLVPMPNMAKIGQGLDEAGTMEFFGI